MVRKKSVTTRKPHNIDATLTLELRSMYKLLPLLSPDTPKNVIIYAVKQRCGRAYFGKRMITVPVWAMKRPKGEGYVLYYLAHELAHIANQDAGTSDNHGPCFMAHFRKLCPVQYQHWELGYKPRRAAAAGIREKRRVVL